MTFNFFKSLFLLLFKNTKNTFYNIQYTRTALIYDLAYCVFVALSIHTCIQKIVFFVALFL